MMRTQWSGSFEQDSPKIIPSPWGLLCPLRVNVVRLFNMCLSEGDKAHHSNLLCKELACIHLYVCRNIVHVS